MTRRNPQLYQDLSSHRKKNISQRPDNLYVYVDTIKKKNRKPIKLK
jgi:hypothetical protein